MNLETKIIIYKFTPQVFTLTLCFIMENTLFPLTEHFVPSYKNKVFFSAETKCSVL